MRRLCWLVVGLTLAGVPSAVAQSNCITINGITRCTAPWQIYDGSARSASVPVLDLTQVWNNPATTFTGLKLNVTDTGSAAASLLLDLQVGGVSRFSVAKAGAIGATSTDGVTFQNTTASTATTTVQMSPRIKWCGTAWNSSSLASETDCFFLETLPSTVAGTTTARLKFGYINTAGTVTYPLQMTNGGGLLFVDNTVDIGAAGANRPANIYAANQVSANTLAILSGATGKFAWGNGNAWASGATPTISSGFGTSPAITGSASVFRVTLGNPVAQAGVVLFNASPAFGSAPFVSCRDETTQTANPPTYTVTSTQVTITFTTAVAADTVVCSVQGLP